MNQQIALVSSILATLCQFGHAEDLADLKAQRILACESAAEMAISEYRIGGSLEMVLEMQEQLVEAKLDVEPTRDKRIEVFTELVKSRIDFEGDAEGRKGRLGSAALDIAAAKAARLRASILLAKSRGDQLPDEQVKNLQEQLVQALEVSVKQAIAEFRIGRTVFRQVVEALEQLADAKLDVTPTRDKRIEILTELVGVCTNAENRVGAQMKARLATQLDFAAAKAVRMRAEVALAKEKRSPKLPALQEQRVLACEEAVELVVQLHAQGRANLRRVYEMQEQLVEAKLDVEPTRDKRIEVFTELVKSRMDLERLVEGRFNAGLASKFEFAAAKAVRLRSRRPVGKEPR